MNYRFFQIPIAICIKAKISGLVTKIQIFNTILLTPGNKTVILANGAFSNGTIVNYSRLGNLRVDITTPAAPDSDVVKTKNVVMETLKANQFVLEDPALSVNKLQVGDGIVTLAIRPFATPRH